MLILPNDPLLEAAEAVLIEENLHSRFHSVLAVTKGHKHTLDGRSVKLHHVFRDNNDEDSIEDHQLHAIKHLKPGQDTEIGPGGAFGTSKLKRTA